MKLAIIFGIALMSAYCVSSEKITNWGNVTARVLGTENIFQGRAFLQPKKIIRFPWVNTRLSRHE